MAGRKPNVGRRDRIVRAALTPVVAVLAVWLYSSVPLDPLVMAAVATLGALAFVLGTGALTGTCGVYAMLGVDTCSCEVDYTGGDSWG